MSKAVLIQEIEDEQIKKDIPDFSIGDTIKIHLRIVEGVKERVQTFQGTVIARKGLGLSETVTLHRVVYGGGIERVFLLHSPKVSKIEIMRRGKVRRSKLYYLRGTYGKKAKVKELIGGRRRKEKGKKDLKAAEFADEVVEIVEEEPITETQDDSVIEETTKE